MFNFSTVLLPANRKSNVTWISPAAYDQVTLRVTATGGICVKMTATQRRIAVLLLYVFFSFNVIKVNK